MRTVVTMPTSSSTWANAATRAAEKVQKEKPQATAFPGVEIDGMPIQPASFDFSVKDRQVMQVLDARGSAMGAMATRI